MRTQQVLTSLKPHTQPPPPPASQRNGRSRMRGRSAPRMAGGQGHNGSADNGGGAANGAPRTKAEPHGATAPRQQRGSKLTTPTARSPSVAVAGAGSGAGPADQPSVTLASPPSAQSQRSGRSRTSGELTYAEFWTRHNAELALLRPKAHRHGDGAPRATTLGSLRAPDDDGAGGVRAPPAASLDTGGYRDEASIVGPVEQH